MADEELEQILNLSMTKFRTTLTNTATYFTIFLLKPPKRQSLVLISHTRELPLTFMMREKNWKIWFGARKKILRKNTNQKLIWKTCFSSITIRSFVNAWFHLILCCVNFLRMFFRAQKLAFFRDKVKNVLWSVKQSLFSLYYMLDYFSQAVNNKTIYLSLYRW